MPLPLLSPVRVTHDIIRFRTRVLAGGSPGRIVGVRYLSSGTAYTVEFQLRRMASAKVTINDLAECDVQADVHFPDSANRRFEPISIA